MTAAVKELDAETAALEARVIGEPLSREREERQQVLRDLDQRRTALVVRRAANQHGCLGKDCEHPDHRRDVHLMSTLIEMLGLPHEYPVITDAERRAHGLRVAGELPHHGGRPPRRPAKNGTEEWGRAPIEKRRD